MTDFVIEPMVRASELVLTVRKSMVGLFTTRNSMPAKKKSAKLLRCPTCGMLVRLNGEDFPFCSDRCRKIDLGKWASGVYKISSPILDPEVLEDLGAFGGGHGKSGDTHDG